MAYSIIKMQVKVCFHILVILTSQWTKGVLCFQTKRTPVVKDYCMQDVFNVTCKRNEVIIINTARLGRMKSSSRCIGENVSINCSVDILHKLDTLCSGKQQCVFKFPGDETGIYDIKPCGTDYMTYMEASHECVKVETTSADQCITRRKIRTTKHHGFISSSTTENGNIGSHHCPWLIETYPGQQINLTVYNLIRNHTVKPYSPYTFKGNKFDGGISNDHRKNVVDGIFTNSLACREIDKVVIGVIYEAGKQRTVTMCKGTNQRILENYISTTNTLEFRFENKNIIHNLGRFLVEYKVTGCPDIEVPSDTWTERIGSTTLVVKCNRSIGETWSLTCSGDTWVGKVGNCSFGSGVEILNLDYNINVEQFPYGILFVVAIGVAIGIVLGGGMLIALVMYNKTREKDHGPFTASVNQGTNSMYVNPQTRAWVQAHSHPKDSDHEQQYIDEGIVRDIQTFHHHPGMRDPALYGDVMGNDGIVRAHNAPNQANVPLNQHHHPHPPHYGPPLSDGRHVGPGVVGGPSHKIPIHDHVGMLSHVYERPQST